MSLGLQNRAKAFLEKSVPEEVDYVPDSISELFIREYAAEGRVGLDPERYELLQICMEEADLAAAEKTGAAKDFFRESAELLRAISEGAEETGTETVEQDRPKKPKRPWWKFW